MSSAPTTRSSISRSSTAWPRAGPVPRSSTIRGRRWRLASSSNCNGVPICRRGSRRSTSPTCMTRSSCSKTTPHWCTSAPRSSSSACSPTSIWFRRCASVFPTSTTSICASMNACTSAPHAEGDSVARRERYIVGLDVGTSTVVCVVCEGMDDNSLHVVGIGVAESRGIKRGAVGNLEAAVDSIKKAIEEAELMAGIEIDSVYLALSGPHVKGFNSRGVIAVAGKNREITRDDVRRAIDAAKAVALPTGREILHVLPQDFVVDDQDGIGAPIGMTGARLEVNVHVVTGAVSSTQNIVACVNRAGVNVVDT